MTSNNEMNEFRALCFKAVDASNRLDSTLEFEADFLNVLTFIKDQPFFLQQFKDYFLSMVNDPVSVPFELIAFCMYELRWVEVKEAAKCRLAEGGSPSLKNLMAKVLNAYSDSWDGRDLYSYYSSKNII